MKVMGWPAFSNRASNPYTSLLYDAMIRNGAQVIEFSGLRGGLEKSDIFHLHWPDVSLKHASSRKAFIEGARTLLIVLLARLQGARIVWTAHNLQSHDHLHPQVERLFWWTFLRELDGVISLSEGGLKRLYEKRPFTRTLPAAPVAHGHYREAYPNTVTKEEARCHLGINESAFVVGWIGQIRAYKGLPELVNAWATCTEPEKVLLIAGQSPEPALEHFLQEQASKDPSIHFHPGRVEDGDLQHFIHASNVLVMPYRKILNSGSALLGLSFDCPVALPRSEVMTELQNQVGPEWVYLYDGEFTDAILNDICGWARQISRPKKADLSILEWDLIAQKTLAFFERVKAGNGAV